tara:strand:+ start:3261 stop:3953 length:693 start_codon:yes stop_codon:yes gene_type:complete
MEFSEDYQKMLDLHEQAHKEGAVRNLNGEDIETEGRKIFEGSELLPMLPTIKEIKDDLNLTSLLDYGCGKANAYYLAFELDGVIHPNAYQYLGIAPAAVHLYDPCVEQFRSKPRQEQTYDIVVCTDVLEHIPEQDVDTVIEEMVYHANKLMVFKIAAHESFTKFKDGTNVHATVKPPSWWFDKIIRIATESGRTILLHIEVEERESGSDGKRSHISRHIVNQGNKNGNTG